MGWASKRHRHPPVTSSVGGTHFPNFTNPRVPGQAAFTVSELAAKREEFWHTSPS